MGVVRANTPVEDRTSGGARLEGSIGFDYKKRQFLSRTPPTAGNQQTWTLSGWYKPNYGDTSNFLGCITSSPASELSVKWYINGILISDGQGTCSVPFAARFRDREGWNHYVIIYDTTESTNTDRVKLYINGLRITETYTTYNSLVWPAQGLKGSINSATRHSIGNRGDGISTWYDGKMSNVHFIDSQAVLPTEFGYEDTITNTWRPKKYEGSYEVAASSATGANPILLTTNNGASTDGSVDTTDPAKANIKIALPLQDDTNDVHHLVKGSGSAVTVTAVDAKYTSSYSKYYGASGDFTDSTDRFSMEVSNSDGHFDIGTGDCCIEWWAYYPSTPGSNGYIFRSDTTNGVECYAYAHASGTVAVKFGTFTWDAWPGSSGNHDDFSNGVWNHFCIERNGSTWTAYMNGTAKRTTSNGVDANPGDTMGIGNYNNSHLSYYAKCYFQDFRWYTASKYGGNDFQPPSFGANSFHLPFDGLESIGVDKSGNGNNWYHSGTRGNQTFMDKADAAFPILETSQGGTSSRGNVRGRVGVGVSVYNDGGGNKFYFDGVKAPSLNYVRGQTVTFDQGDSTNSGHQLLFSTISDGPHSSTTHYSTKFTRASTNYLNVPASSDFSFGTDAFTMEGWVYDEGDADPQVIMASSGYYNAASPGNWNLRREDFDNWTFYTYDSQGTAENIDFGVVTRAHKWYHFALVREGTGTNGVSLYVNGKWAGSGTVTKSLSDAATNGITIGAATNHSQWSALRLSNIRILKGTALYTSDPFNPPTEPLTDITNTVLLCCNQSSVTAATVSPGTIIQTNTPTSSQDYSPFIFNGGMSNSKSFPSNVNGTRVSGIPGTTESYGIDFSNDVIKVAQTNNEFGFQDDFTCEAWVYVDNFTTDCGVFSNWDTGNNRSIIVGPNASGNNKWTFIVNSNGSGGWTTVANPSATTGVWTHLALSFQKQGTKCMAFVNGILQGASTVQPYNKGDANWYFGINKGDASGYFDGKMTNMRLSKCCRYTEHFVPQRHPFIPDADTIWLGGIEEGTIQPIYSQAGATTAHAGSPTTQSNTDIYNRPFTGITFPHQAPNTLYYYCASHSGMGGSVGLSTDNSVADEYASCLTMALPLNINSVDYSERVNWSVNDNSIFARNNATGITTQSPFYGSSMYFDGTSGTNGTKNVGTNNGMYVDHGGFCQECWVYYTEAQGSRPINFSHDLKGNGYVYLEIGNWQGSQVARVSARGGNLSGHIYQMDNSDTMQSSTPITYLYGVGINEWHHIAYTWDERTSRVFLDGTMVVEEKRNNAHYRYIFKSMKIRVSGDEVGWPATGDDCWGNIKGHICDARMYWGTPKYTKNFKPPSVRPSLLQESPSTTAYPEALTHWKKGGSLLLPGENTGDAITYGSAILPNSASDKWCVDLWIYPHEGHSGQKCIWEQHDGGSGRTGLFINTDATGGYGVGYPVSKYRVYLIHGANFKPSYSAFCQAHQWQFHRCICDGSYVYHYVDGKFFSKQASQGVDNTGFEIGTINGSDSYRGNIADFRIVTGNGVDKIMDKVTSVPSEPLENITGTQFLGCNSTSNPATMKVTPGAWTVNNDVQSSFLNPYNELPTAFRGGNRAGYAKISQVDRNLYQHRANVMNNGLTYQAGVHGGYYQNARADMELTGKRYWEVQIKVIASLGGGFGVVPGSDYDYNIMNETGAASYFGHSNWGAECAAFYPVWQTTYSNSGTIASGGAAVMGDYGMVAYDRDTGKLWFGKNGQWLSGANVFDGRPELGLNPTYTLATTYRHFPGFTTYDDGTKGAEIDVNFGQQPFKYPPPEGFLPLCEASNDRPVFTQPNKQAIAVRDWSGSGAQRQIDCGFQPDLVVIKSTTDAFYWRVFDSVRGMKGETNKALYFNTGESAGTNSANDGALDANAGGFDISTSGAYTNGSGDDFVGYAWKAGGNKGTWNLNGRDAGSLTAAGLNYGDTSVLTGASVNTQTGFSVVTWTQDSGGASKNIAHGLTKAPNFVIMKHTNAAVNWFVTHTSLSSGAKVLYTNSTSGEDTSSDFGNAFPGATYTATQTTGVNGREVVMYSWHDVPGLQKFGQYYGNGNNEFGTMVVLDFKPSLLIIKRVSSTGGWNTIDNVRSTYNPSTNRMELQSAAANDTHGDYTTDFYSNGFCIISDNAEWNGDGEKYVYMAWADTPRYNLYGGAATSR